jgi:hypothetical protein
MYGDKFAAFDTTEVPYKVVNDQPIKAYIMVPKNDAPGKHPIVAKFHGGFFVSPTPIQKSRSSILIAT